MNKFIATFFIFSCIAFLVNSTPIDSADNAKPSARDNGQYEVTPMPTGPIFISTIPPGPRSRDLHDASGSGKSGDVPSTAAGTKAPPPPVVQNSSNGSVSPPDVLTTVPPKPTTTSIPTLPTVAPANETTNATTLPPTTTTPTTLPPTTTPITPPTNATTTTTVAPTPTLVPVTTPSTTPAAASTTPAPAPAPSKDRRFDGPSFIGGIVLSLGIMAIGFVAWKFYKARTERNYHTL